MQLVLGDYLKQNPEMSKVIEQASELISWFNNHSYALNLLYAEQTTCPDIGNVALALIRAVITRWASHVYSLGRLLRVETPLRSVVLKRGAEIRESAGKKKKEKEKADEILAIVRDQHFWEVVARYDCDVCDYVTFHSDSKDSSPALCFRIHNHLEPLAIAINICQGSGTRGDQVALVFGRMYKHYTDLAARDVLQPSPACAILDSLDKRWEKADHDFLITSLVLNPWIKMSLFSVNVAPAQIIPILVKMYQRVFKDSERDDSAFASRAFQYVVSPPTHDIFGLKAGKWGLRELNNGIPVSSRTASSTCSTFQSHHVCASQ